MTTFDPVDPKVRFPDLEAKILAWWNDARIFERSLEARRDAPPWVFYEGPPTANGRPGIHHVEPRTFKDVYPRFKTMTGHLVHRKGGWDCHGLPVELETEKEIGSTGKKDIEAFGIARFNDLCRASVQRYVAEFERLTERIGFWIDMSDAYWTMSTEYVESVWWSLKQLHQRGLLTEDHKVTAYCPRCGTALSDAEVAQGYATVEDPSTFVLLPIIEAPDPSLVGAALLVWTTTPWTLPANTGAAVDPEATYVEVQSARGRLVMAEALREPVLGEGTRALREMRGADLVGLRYEPPYPNIDGAHTVVGAGFVSMQDGTGIVHLAPAFGPDDLAIGRAQGWALFKPVGDDGRFTHEAPLFVQDLFVKDADPVILADLRERGLLLKEERYEHAYPFCWRCATPLLYYARTSWYVRTTDVKDRLLEVNDSVAWYPDHIRDGRFGNWLENNVDWALSRERYWGTPLPIWRCEEGHQTAVGSLAELSDLAGRDVRGVDPHRPAIDEITIACSACSGVATRVTEVIDAWYDSGAMPFAQWGYHPELDRGIEAFERTFPADFISEAIDQTRGWFYTLMAEGVLHFDSATYRNVVCLGHIVAEDGRKMSKSLGNVFDPWEALDRQGADALRWWMITNGSPWESRRIGHEILDEAVRQLLLPLWNTYSFFVTYANASGFDPAADAPTAARTPMDRWIASRLASTVSDARARLEAYDATGAGRSIQAFIDELSNWYVRRCRRRFWNPDGRGGADSTTAFVMLRECLITVAALLAPFTPFVSEALWRNLAAGREGLPDSVHLAEYPLADTQLIDHSLDEEVELARQIVELGRRVRVDTRTKTRQPLAGALVHLPARGRSIEHLLADIAEELNVRVVRVADPTDTFGSWRAKPDFKMLGPRLGSGVKAVAAVLSADDGSIANRLAAGEQVEISIDQGRVPVGPEDVVLTRSVPEGWGVTAEGGVSVALDLSVSSELLLEGTARDLIRAVQDARKAAGLHVSDRIELAIEAGASPTAALEAHRDLIASETLAVGVQTGSLADPEHTERSGLGAESVTITLRRA